MHLHVPRRCASVSLRSSARLCCRLAWHACTARISLIAEVAGKLEAVWLLTAITRASVAVFVWLRRSSQTLEAGWLTVAVFDGACVLIQAIGLRKGWLADAAR
jgi:hypothetical protein